MVTEEEARRRRSDGWFRDATVLRQERAYASLLAGMRAGSPRIDLRVASEAVDRLGRERVTLLEVGCGSGYYSEVFSFLPKTTVEYVGLDYSPAMIARARKRYPGAKFDQGDATALAFSDRAFDVVFNGVSLMHILDYGKAIAESARLARVACIFHSVPVFRHHQTVYIRKYAYGSPVVEIVFNRDALISVFERNGLSMLQSWESIPYDVSELTREPSRAETFLCIPKRVCA